METVTVAVPPQIAKKYGKKVVDYKELLAYVEEHLWVDVDVNPKMKMEDFYALIKDGTKATKDHQ
ncbi:MAG: hypothetical protein WD512_10655 [Candidatus Paceibacterota bacterium]